jgi:molybdate-binding protein/DNA-binding XRE family transcriptional regulator
MTQEELARRAGLSRQSLHAIESGRSVPSTAAALRLGSVLGAPLEELFWLEEGAAIRAELTGPPAPRVALAEIDGRWVAHPLASGEALHVAADGLRKGARIEPLRPVHELRRNLLAAGCDPALGLLAARLGGRDFRLGWVDAPSETALAHLRRGRAHLAGAHLLDEASGEYNVPFVRELFAGRAMVIVTLASWELGFAVARGNPLRIRRASDLARPSVRLVNRAPGAGARKLLDRLLRSAGVPSRSLCGYDRIASGHLEAAQTVRSSGADVAVVPRAVALAHGLGFVPLSQERFDLVLSRESLSDERISRALDVLASRSFRRELSALSGYDVSRCGRIAAEVRPA